MKNFLSLLLLVGLTVVQLSCQDENEDPAPESVASLSLHKGKINQVDSAYVEFEQNGALVKKPFTLTGDSLKILMQEVSGALNIKVVLYTAPPAHENRGPEIRYAYKAHIMLPSAAANRSASVISAPGTPSFGPIRCTWDEFYVYKSDKLLWWVPKNPCNPYLEVKSNTYNYFYCDRIFMTEDCRIIQSEAKEAVNSTLSQPLVIENAFPLIQAECPIEKANANAMLIAMDEATGEEVILYHRW